MIEGLEVGAAIGSKGSSRTTREAPPGDAPTQAPGAQRASRARPGRDLRPDWWRHGVVYQVYPRSFADGHGDGVGDLPGLLARLDHLAGTPESLGVDALWLSPIYPSPGRDLGYDVSDHASIDPLFGSDEDFDRLIAEAHQRGLHVILDLVLNHTSDEHAWFRESRASRNGPYADWYLWRDPAGFDRRGRPIPPNNWVSFFGGSAWSWEPARGQFYLHTFLREQPDLNWRNPAVVEAQLAIVRGWLDRGVDGLRLDVFNAFLKDPELRANPRRRRISRRPWDRQHQRNNKDQPDLGEVIGRLRALVDEAPGRMTVGELFEGTTENAAAFAADRHLVFDFELLATPWSAGSLREIIEERERAFGSKGWPTVVLSNHDQPRHAARFAINAGTGDSDAIAKASALLLLTLRGTAFIYYGEELGLGNLRVPKRKAIDPPARRAGLRFPWWNRDQARAPMPWEGTRGAGFTTGKPWLPLPEDYALRNVARQSAEPDSVLACYRRLLRARQELGPLHGGSFEWVPSGHPDVLAWERRLGRERVLVLLNCEPRPVVAKLARSSEPWVPLAGTNADLRGPFRGGVLLPLRPFEGLIAVPASRVPAREEPPAGDSPQE